MKALDIALNDMTRSFRSFFAVVFMFIVPLMVTGMFYFMFGNIAKDGDFNLPKTKVVVANLDEGGPQFNINTKNIPGGKKAHTMGELIVGILESDEMAKLIDLAFVPDAGSARAAVDNQSEQVAIIIPADFSRQFADLNKNAVIEFYQDPTLTIGPSIIRAILNRFTEGMASVKIAVNVFMDEALPEDQGFAGAVVDHYLKISLVQADDPAAKLLEIRAPSGSAQKTAQDDNPLLRIISPIMGGMMIFYAFFTGTSTAESILKEEEERTLPRLFTTPTSQTTILSGKFLSVFLTVSVQVSVLLIAAELIFGIRWGALPAVLLAALGIIFSASSFGIFINSLLKNTKQGGVIFGGVLTVTSMLGMISIFAMNSPSAKTLSDTVSLLVPQGWAIRALMQAMNGEPVASLLLTTLILLIWSTAFFTIGVLRFNRRYA